MEQGAGLGSGLQDTEYEAAGAKMVSAADAWGAEMVIKVKEPLPAEYEYMRKGLLLFTYLHLAADKPLTEAVLNSGVTGIAYETVQLPDRSLPLLMPMSEVAGRMATQEGAHHLERSLGGRGVLLGGVSRRISGFRGCSGRRHRRQQRRTRGRGAWALRLRFSM